MHQKTPFPWVILITPSGIATVGHGWKRASLHWPGWVVRFAQIQRVFWRGGGG